MSTTVTKFNHRALVVEKYNRLLRRLEEFLDRDLPDSEIYSAAALRRRWLQKFDMLTFDYFSVNAMKEFEAGIFDPYADSFLNSTLNGFRFKLDVDDRKSFRIEISSLLFLKELVLFIAIVLFVLLGFVRAWFRGLQKLIFRGVDSDRRPAAVTSQIGMDVLQIEASDASFVEFCKKGPVTVLNSAERIYVQADSPVSSVDPGRMSYSRWPLFQLIEDFQPSVFDLFSFVIMHVSVSLKFLMSCLLRPYLVSLGRDFAFHALVTWLNQRRQISNFFIHGGNFEAQYLWMTDLPNRGFALHLVWYSLNVRWHVYKENPMVWNDPHYQYMKVDHSWVWVNSIIPWISSVGLNPVNHVVGPILWYLPQSPKIDSKRELSVSVYDITPPTKQWERDRGFVGHYYNTGVISKFVQDIVEATAAVAVKVGRPIKVRLKHKRSFAAHHDAAYIQFVADLVKSSPHVEIVAPNINLFRCLAESSIAVAVPYSSPVYAAACMGIPGIFYDSSETIIPYEIIETEIQFVAGRLQLEEVLSSHFLALIASAQ